MQLFVVLSSALAWFPLRAHDEASHLSRDEATRQLRAIEYSRHHEKSHISESYYSSVSVAPQNRVIMPSARTVSLTPSVPGVVGTPLNGMYEPCLSLLKYMRFAKIVVRLDR